MTIERSTSAELAPFELLDVLVQNRRDRAADRSLLSLHFVGKRGRHTDRLKMPLLTWFDANRLQQFTHKLANATQPENCFIDLPDSGLRLVANAKNCHSIRVEAHPSAERRFTPVEINSTANGLSTYAKLLYTRLWEAFCRG